MLRLSAWASQTVNVWLLLGHHDQTVSARCYINRYKKGWKLAYKAINALFFWQENHCKSSFEQDIAYALEVLSISNAQ
jgi:hypothetical protein